MRKVDLNKCLILVITCLFILGSILPNISGSYLNKNKNQISRSSDKIESLNYIFSFSKPEIKKQGENLRVVIKEANSYTSNLEDAKTPYYTKTFTIPFGSNIIDLKCVHSQPETITLEKNIDILSNDFDIPDSVIEENHVDNNQWYQCKTGGGIKNGKHVFFVTFTFYPIKYNEAKNKLLFTKNFEIFIKYEKPSSLFFEDNEYELLIITPNNFQKSLEKLVEHKNNHGLTTKLVTLEDIYEDTYFTIDGRDEAEEIKYFIFNAFKDWGIDFVLLVGNINKMPIRKTWMGSGEYKRTPLTDLYYADICFGNGSFCSWDSNDNGYYGEIAHLGIHDDIVDLYADVYIGRIACNNIFELNTVINKIIQYENDAYGTEWSNNCLLIGGDTHPSHNNYAEGEILIDIIADITPTLNHIMLKTSDNTFSHDSLNDALNNDGAGFVCYAGHGFEIGLSTHPPNSEEWISYDMKHLFDLKNKDKLPIVFFNACLTARLDYNILNLIADLIYFSSTLPKLNKRDDIEFPILFPCIAWEMVSYQKGGAIASIGATRLSYGMIGESGEISGGCGYIALKFFEALSDSTYLSEMLVYAQNDFLDNAAWRDPFIVEEMVLLGDPTLKIGGYE